MGKAYANKKVITDRPLGDFYSTPTSLTLVARDIIEQEIPKEEIVLEPCAGDGGISIPLRNLGYIVKENDLYRGGVDYLSTKFEELYVVTNPPFSLWDEFVKKIKKESLKSMVIGRLNYFGTDSRSKSGIWNNLKSVFCFNRYIDYRTPFRDDGRFYVGATATAWFLFDSGYCGDATIHVLDVQKYASLGQYKGV